MEPKPDLGWAEKRREVRGPGHGLAQIRWSNPQEGNLEGRLKDVSPNGFRIVHSTPNLAPGTLVEFSHFTGRGRARVVWTRIVKDTVESGFLVVHDNG